jgi:tetratricopeptide (TPR) repeat protein
MRPLSYAIAIVALLLATAAATAEESNGCANQDPERRITLCTALIDTPGTPAALRANAFFLRGLAFLELGQYQRAIKDYDEAIRINPLYAAALNNRADAHLRMGEPAQGVPDIERALAIDPYHPIYNATRGEIGQSLGDREGAMRDHEAAMTFGGPTFVKFYQCGLRLARLYDGPLDGVLRPELHTALRLCVDKGIHCDPLLAIPVLECPEPAV